MFTNGMRSSEFWVTIITVAVNFANQVFGWGIAAEDMALALGPAMAYIVSRGLAKLKSE